MDALGGRGRPTAQGPHGPCGPDAHRPHAALRTMAMAGAAPGPPPLMRRTWSFLCLGGQGACPSSRAPVFPPLSCSLNDVEHLQDAEPPRALRSSYRTSTRTHGHTTPSFLVHLQEAEVSLAGSSRHASEWEQGGTHR